MHVRVYVCVHACPAGDPWDSSPRYMRPRAAKPRLLGLVAPGDGQMTEKKKKKKKKKKKAIKQVE